MDEILHAPQFQRLEACWRGLERACRDLRACRAVSLELLPTSRKELKERFHGRVFEPEYEVTSPPIWPCSRRWQKTASSFRRR